MGKKVNWSVKSGMMAAGIFINTDENFQFAPQNQNYEMFQFLSSDGTWRTPGLKFSVAYDDRYYSHKLYISKKEIFNTNTGEKSILRKENW